MKKKILLSLLLFQVLQVSYSQKNDHTSSSNKKNQVRTANGIVEGTIEKSGVASYKGIPFATPPVGALRWKEPQPVKNWTGVRKADKFAPNAVQSHLFGDMIFRSDGMSEDCLYLNVWVPAEKSHKLLPVMVYFYGGGFVAGDGSESRYDGESMAMKGIITLTVNYRLGIFGFFSHPELTKESAHKASGNYALLDLNAALRWVNKNIGAFGGDPKRVTIAGESAGSIAVSAEMASPLSKNLIAGAIGESGSLMGALPAVPLARAEQTGLNFATSAGAGSLEALRALPAEKLLELAAKFGVYHFAMTVDGYFFPKKPLKIYEAGEQAQVPLLVGWNSQENNYRSILGNEKPTKENFSKAVKKLYGEKTDEILKLYNAPTDDEVEKVATDLASDRFISFSTWKWATLQGKTGKPVYRYLYEHPRPVTIASDTSVNKKPADHGAVHSAEIEYALGNLPGNKVFAWTQDDYKVSRIMQEYFANFIKTGDPNSTGLPKWSPANKGNTAQVMHIDVNTTSEEAKNESRYLYLNQFYNR
jgi:para-nitrobenzyl esterase